MATMRAGAGRRTTMRKLRPDAAARNKRGDAVFVHLNEHLAARVAARAAGGRIA